MFKDNTEAQRFEWVENGETVFADYRDHGSHTVIPYVEAPLPLRGTGAADRLMQALIEHARAKNLKLRPTCSYAVAWFRRHPKAHDVLA